MEYSSIVNPETGRRVNIYGELGKNILANYLEAYQTGGKPCKFVAAKKNRKRSKNQCVYVTRASGIDHSKSTPQLCISEHQRVANPEFQTADFKPANPKEGTPSGCKIGKIKETRMYKSKGMRDRAIKCALNSLEKDKEVVKEDDAHQEVEEHNEFQEKKSEISEVKE